MKTFLIADGSTKKRLRYNYGAVCVVENGTETHHICMHARCAAAVVKRGSDRTLYEHRNLMSSMYIKHFSFAIMH